MTHAVDGGELFHCDLDRKVYLGLLQRVCERHNWRLITFVLMDNHLHLLVIAATRDLSAGMWWMHWRYAEYYKARDRPHLGHVFAGRPKTKPIRSDAYFLAVVRYIALNPVGVFCERPEQYRWSAHRAIVGDAPAVPMLGRDELLGWFGPGDAIVRYETFVAGAEPVEHCSVRRWACKPPEGRPDLDELVADRSASSFVVAHETWEYSIRAIARAAGLSHTTVRRSIARA